MGVIGASGRAAAMSLRRAGHSPWVVDLFADRDLQRIAPCVRCPFEDYPAALPKLCEAFPPGPVSYTGGLENHPEVVRAIAASHELWGNGPEVLEQVRDPFRVHDIFSNAGFRVPRIATMHDATCRWIRKSHSSGGMGIRWARTNEPLHAGDYLQEYIAGPSLSAQFATTNGVTQLLGITEQLIGESSLHAEAFRYAGNIGPLSIGDHVCDELRRLGCLLATTTGIHHVWGMDFILFDGHPYIIEVNPRYTAAMEVIEMAQQPPFSRDPESAEGSARHPALLALPSEDSGSRLNGKAIYFAPQRITFPHAGPWDADLVGTFDPWRIPGFADIPAPGEIIERGWPVLTFFASGLSAADVRIHLQSQAAELDRLFAEATP